MTLEEWLLNKWLVRNEKSPAEIRELLKTIDRDLADARVTKVSPDRRMTIAYEAALLCANAALAASGFRAARESHHLRIIKSLAFTMTTDSRIINRLDAFRKKRNISTYERAGTVTEKEVKEVLE